MIYALGIGALTTAALVSTGACSKKKPNVQDAAISHAATCIFCPKSETNKRSVIEAQKIGETKNVRALLDTVPMVGGHTLLTPCTPKMRAHEISDIEVLAEHDALVQLTKLFKKEYGADDYLVLQKNGPPAGQSILHYHKHVYPIASNWMRVRANINFAIKFLTFGICSSKLQGQKLARVRNDLSSKLQLADVSQLPSKESVEPLVEIQVKRTQIGPGHVVIRTKRHIEKAHERTPEEVLACHHALQKIVRTYKAVFDTEDYVQIEENGKAAGQSSPHFQTHVYAVPKTNHPYLRQLEALVKYSFTCMRSEPSIKPGSLHDRFVRELQNKS